MDAGLSESMLYYFAYGSNLHPVRLRERVPSANLLGVVELGKHRLAFHKKSQDGSSKCNLVCTEEESDRVYGAIYQMDSVHRQALDCFEDNGNGYDGSQLVVEMNGKEYSCFTYFAQSSYIENDVKPYHWYKNLVILGAKYLHFPEVYVRSIEAVESVVDHDEPRRRQHESLIEDILNHRAR